MAYPQGQPNSVGGYGGLPGYGYGQAQMSREAWNQNASQPQSQTQMPNPSQRQLNSQAAPQQPATPQAWQQATPTPTYQQPHQQYQSYYQQPYQSQPYQNALPSQQRSPRQQAQYWQPPLPQYSSFTPAYPQLQGQLRPQQLMAQSSYSQQSSSPAQQPATQAQPRTPLHPWAPRDNLAPTASQKPPTPTQQPQRSGHSQPPPVLPQQSAPKESPSLQRKSSATTLKQEAITPRRVVAYVQIQVPSQGADQMLSQPTPQHSRSPKRRRSNDGRAVAVKLEHPHPLPHPQSATRRPTQTIQSSPLTELQSSQLPPTPQSKTDNQAVLLTLAEEYISVAHSMGASIASGAASEEDVTRYYAMMSTAMGCLDSVLKNYRQQDPRKEARIRLQLAALLYEETESVAEAEGVLSQGITMCERSRLSNQKYAMQHLLVRVLLKSNPKAAFKTIEKVITEVEALKLQHWAYAFRFLRVSLGMHLSGASETASMLRHLSAITASADDRRDIAVLVTAATVEAMVHLRSNASDALELAQRAIAAAQMHQLMPEMKYLPQIQATLGCLGLACAIATHNWEQITAKMEHMQGELDSLAKRSGWQKDGTFLISLGGKANTDLGQETLGIMRTMKSSDIALSMQWLDKTELYSLGFLLSALAHMPRNNESKNSTNCLRAGIECNTAALDLVKVSVAASEAVLQKQKASNITMQSLLALAYCGRAEWAEAESSIEAVRSRLSSNFAPQNEMVSHMLLYLQGVCKQGQGKLDSALELYASLQSRFDSDKKGRSPLKDLRALATMNSILILREDPDLSKREHAEQMFANVETYCRQHPDKSFFSAYNVMKATLSPLHADGSIITTKQSLAAALSMSQANKNKQLTCLVMNIMAERFFANIVGDQALKSAGVAVTLAKQYGDPLWVVVAAGMYRDKLERGGDTASATAVEREARVASDRLPADVREKLSL